MASASGTKLLAGAVITVAAAVLGLGMLQERAQAPSTGSATAAGELPAPRPSEPQARPDGSESKTAPHSLDPTPEALLDEACESKKVTCDCRKDAILRAISLSLAGVAETLLDAVESPCEEDLAQRGIAAETRAWLGQIERAQSSADPVLLQDPKNPHATFAVALIHFHRGDYDRAREMAQRALDFGRKAPALVLLGVLSLREQETQAATASFDEALTLEPKNVEARFNRAVLHEQAGDYNAARRGYLKALAARPGHVDSRYALARLTFSAGAIDEARHHLRKLVEIAPGDPRVEPLSKSLMGQKSEDRIEGTLHEP